MAQRTNTDTGKPSGVNKEESGTGIPSKISDEAMPQNDDATARYTNDDNDTAEGVRTLHPNRNVDKQDGSNIGGYRE